MIYFIFFFIFLCILQYLFIKYIKINESEESLNLNQLIINIKNNNYQIDKNIENILKERINLLNNKNVNYKEWLNYNNKNKYIKINNLNNLSITIYEKIPNTDDFILRVHSDESLINQSWTDIITIINKILYLSRFEADNNLIKNMFNTNKDNDINTISYNWVHTKNYIVTKLKSIYYKYKTKEGIEGVIFIEYPIENSSKIFNIKKIYNINNYKLFFGYLIFIILSIVFYFINANSFLIIKAYIFVIIINIYFWIYFNSFDQLSTTENENENLKINSSSILSLSYLLSINIFIIGSLNIFKHKTITKETLFLFSFSLILLLFCIIKIDPHHDVVMVIKERVSLNFLFNFSIILNVCMVLNYLIYKYNTNYV
jgi:hypothetical protein